MKKLEIVKNAIRNRRTESKPDYRDVAAVLLFIFLLPYIVSFFFGNAGIEKKEGGEQTEGEAAWGTKESGRTELFWEDIGKAEFIVCNTTAAGNLFDQQAARYDPYGIRNGSVEGSGRGSADGNDAFVL